MNEVAETIARGVCPSCTWRGDVELVNGVCPQCDVDWFGLSPDNNEIKLTQTEAFRFEAESPDAGLPDALDAS